MTVDPARPSAAQPGAIDWAGRRAIKRSTSNQSKTYQRHDYSSMAIGFTYRGLELSQTQIRLLHISEGPTEGSTEDSINCSLVRVDINACPPYRALSYTWTSPPSSVSRRADPKSILINGAPLGIGDNLWEFLRLVSRGELPFANKPIWVDQICIDQENESEKNQQVARMGSVFAQAEQVLAWLGPEADGSHAAMQYLVDLCTRSWKLKEPPGPPESFKPYEHGFNVYCRRNRDMLKKIVRYLKCLYDGMPAHRANLIKLLRRPYWMRLWVLQEVKLARDLLVICGSAWLPRRIFQLCLCLLFQEVSRSSAPAETIFQPVGVFTSEYWGYLHPVPDFKVLDTSVIKTLRGQENVPFSTSYWWELLLEAAKLKCRDSVDYVYGLQALLAEADQILVDYSIGSGELFWKVFAGFEGHRANADKKAAIIQFGRRMNVTGREVVCKKGTGSVGRARFRSIFGQDPEEVFQTQSHHDELVETAVPDRSLPGIDIGNPEIMELLGLVNSGAAGPELSIKDQQPFDPSHILSSGSVVFREYIDSNWWRTWYTGI